MSDQTDPVLLERYVRSGDDAEFRPLVDRYASLVYGACLARLGQRELAEDATQAVFLLLARKAPKMRPPLTLAPWLLAASRHISLRMVRAERRRRDRERPLDEGLSSPETTAALSMAEALGRLRGTERDAVALRFVHGLSLSDVGAQLGISEDAARMRVQRALSRLRRDLAPLGVVPASLTVRLTRPLTASAAVTKLAHEGFLMFTPHPLLLGPIAAAAVIGAAALAPSHAVQTSTRPASPGPVPASSLVRPKVAPSGVSLPHGKKAPAVNLRFEEYLGKDQAWFAKHFDAPEGGTGLGGGRSGGPVPLEWRTYERRKELGGGKGQTASATYPIGDPTTPFAKVLSIGFDGPIGREPVATHVDHGIDLKPSRTLEQEAAYVGVKLADYRAIGSDPSGVPGNLRFVHGKRPDVMLEANSLNDTWHLSLRLDPLQGR